MQQQEKHYRINSITGYAQVFIFAILILYFGKALFVPMCYGLFIAIVSYPVCKWLEAKGFNKNITIAICLSVVFLLILMLLTLFVLQVNALRQDIPKLEEKILSELPYLQHWVQENFLITYKTQSDWAARAMERVPSNIAQLLKVFLYTSGNILFAAFLVPVHTALFLYHRQTFVKFLYKVVGEKYRSSIESVLLEVIHTYYRYIKGMVKVYIIVGVLNSIGLSIIGIRHAILFGMLTAIMTIIPYVGILVSAAIPIVITYVTTGSLWDVAGIIGVFSFVQYLEANIIFPRVVSTQLNVSTWATFVAIIAGGIIWGVSGMILFIPFVAILKIVSDRFQELDTLNIILKRS